MIDLGGFVMEKGMLQGIQDRAEGRFPPAYAEILGIVLWLLALAAGLVGAVSFVTRRSWQLPLAVGLLAVVALLALTFLQPALWVRAVMAAALLAGAVRAARPGVERRPDVTVRYNRRQRNRGKLRIFRAGRLTPSPHVWGEVLKMAGKWGILFRRTAGGEAGLNFSSRNSNRLRIFTKKATKSTILILALANRLSQAFPR